MTAPPFPPFPDPPFPDPPFPDPPFPGPLRRRGPRPLAQHLMHAAGIRPISPDCAPDWSGWNNASTLLDADPALIAGIAAYRRHPFSRDLADPPAIWSEGGSRLLDYGGDGPTLLVVPSLVNRAHVLDLLADRSMLRWLAGSGVRTLLLDWGWPEQERAWTLTDYVAGRLERAIACVGGPLVLVGYCMGGLLALAAALRRPERLLGLALLATPWDFQTENTAGFAALLPLLEPLMATTGTLPVDALQWLLALPTLDAVAERYRAFGAEPQDTDRARAFVALEDWLADGVPLAASVAREALGGWYGRNSPAAGEWRIAGEVVDPARIGCPAFVAVPDADLIVPPASALALARRLPRVSVQRPRAGHVGMVAGARAEFELWRPLRAWIGSVPTA